jgi:hypothetical protein
MPGLFSGAIAGLLIGPGAKSGGHSSANEMAQWDASGQMAGGFERFLPVFGYYSLRNQGGRNGFDHGSACCPWRHLTWASDD